MNDTIRAAIMLVITNAISALVLFNIVHWNGDQIAGLTAFVNSTTLLLAYLLKNGQQASGTSSALTVTSTPVPNDGENPVDGRR